MKALHLSLSTLLMGMALLGFSGCGGAGGTSIGFALPPPSTGHTAYVLQSDGTTSSVLGLPISSSGSLGTVTSLTPPAGLKVGTIATDGVGEIYMGGTLTAGGGEVAVYAPGATGAAMPIRVIAGTSTGLKQPLSMTVDGTGQLYVSDITVGSTLVFSGMANGNVLPTRTLTNNMGFGMATDEVGNLYLAGFPGTNGVAVFGPTANGADAPARIIAGTATTMSAIGGIAVDANGTLFVANLGGGSVLVFAPGANGNVAPARTIAGSATKLANPQDLAVDSTGMLYVCDVATFSNDTGPSVDVFAAGATGNVAPLAHLTSSLWTETLDAVFALY